LVLELKDCNREIANDLTLLREIAVSAAREAGATVMGESFHRFEPHGVSGVVIIAESYLSLHTWPEYGYVAADIFTCGDSCRPEEAADLLIEALECKSPSITELRRGQLDLQTEAYGNRPTQMVV
jgi:S-adenosylmethionine decarboxylase